MDRTTTTGKNKLGANRAGFGREDEMPGAMPVLNCDQPDARRRHIPPETFHKMQLLASDMYISHAGGSACQSSDGHDIYCGRVVSDYDNLRRLHEAKGPRLGIGPNFLLIFVLL